MTLVSGWERPVAEPVGAVEERGAAWDCLDRYISCTCCRYISSVILIQEDATTCLSITEPWNKAQCHPFLPLQPPPCKTGTEMLPRAKQWKEKNHARNKPTQRCRNSQLLCASELQETQQNWIWAPGAPRAAPVPPSQPAPWHRAPARCLPAPQRVSSRAGLLSHHCHTKGPKQKHCISFQPEKPEDKFLSWHKPLSALSNPLHRWGSAPDPVVLGTKEALQLPATAESNRVLRCRHQTCFSLQVTEHFLQLSISYNDPEPSIV